jgi:hypothetical protein
VSCCLAVSAHAASNTYTINDDQEIAFNSGYDIARVEFTLFDSETLQIDIIPYGVPGDADGDGDPDASSDPGILDSPGVSGLERILMGMVCDYQVGDPCQPNLLLTYANNALTATTTSGNPIPEGSITFAIIDAVPDPDNKPDTYRLTINNLSTVKQQVLGFIPTSVTFGAFSFSAHFGDSQPDDFAPDRNPSTGAVVCELVELAPPVTEAPGTGTIGYWKNHPSEWPVGCDLTLPGSDSNADVFAMNILDAPVKGDKTVILAKQVIGAMLNVCAGNATACTVEGISYDINQTIDSSITWLNTYGPVFSKQKNWNGGDIHQEILDDYNNGKLCAPHR